MHPRFFPNTLRRNRFATKLEPVYLKLVPASLVLIVSLLIITVSTGYLKTSDFGTDEVSGRNAGAVSR